MRILFGIFSLLVFVANTVTAFAAEQERIRVVSQTVGSDELLLALAEPEQIAALSHLAHDPLYASAANEAKAYPKLSIGDAESILKFRPTLVLFANYSRLELIEQIKRAGVQVVVFDRYATLEDSLNNLITLSRLLGPRAIERAETIAENTRQRSASLREKLRDAKLIRVLAPSTYGVLPGAQTTFQDLCDHAAAENLATTLGGISGFQHVSSEKILTWPVEKFILEGDSLEAAIASLSTVAPYAFMPAFQKKRVVHLPSHMLGCVSHRRIDAYEHLARALHPEIFP